MNDIMQLIDSRISKWRDGLALLEAQGHIEKDLKDRLSLPFQIRISELEYLKEATCRT